MGSVAKPLLLANQALGSRNYFNCFDAAFGGLLQYHLGPDLPVGFFYSLFDAPRLNVSHDLSFSRLSRAADPNSRVPQALDVEFKRYQNWEEFSAAHAGRDKPFVAELDEFFIKGYFHFQKAHYCHASLGTRITGQSSFVVLDPDLAFRDTSGYHEAVIDLPNTSDDSYAAFYTIETEIAHASSREELEYQIAAENLTLWNSESISQTSTGSEAVGKRSLELFMWAIQSEAVLQAIVQEFWTWIVPFAWKRDYLRSNSLRLHSSLDLVLTKLIRQLEELESSLLRIRVSKSDRLRDLIRIKSGAVIDTVEDYMILESERIHGKR